MNKEISTLPKNVILNWLYSADMHVSLEKLGKWLEQNTNGKYKLVNTENFIENINTLHKDCV
jgi:hypothetical protein